MIRTGTVRHLALSYEGTIELPHFDKASFRVQNKIFATLIKEKRQAVLMLSVIDQSVFCGYDPAAMYPLPNKWGKKGCTIVDLRKVRKDIFHDALTTAYCRVAPKELANKYQSGR